MTVVFRAYSPNRDQSGTTYADKARATSQAAVRNQFAAVDDSAPDWTVQAGTVRWETP